MRGRSGWWASAGLLALVALCGCGTGSDAADGGTSVPSGTLGGVGVLPDTDPATPTTAPAPAPSDGASTTSSTGVTSGSDQVVTPGTQGAPNEFIIDPGDSPVIDDPRVLLVGDSVLEAAIAGNPDDLDRYVATLGWQMWVDTQRGRHMPQALTRLKKIVMEDPPWRQPVVPQSVVLMIGNNYDETRAEFVTALDDTLAFLHDARRIVMFTVPLYKPQQAEVNTELKAAAVRDPRIILVDWERFSREWKRVLGGDGIHPSDEGAGYLAQLIGLALGAAPGLEVPVDLPTLGTLNDDPLPDWTPKKVRETEETPTEAPGTKPPPWTSTTTTVQPGGSTTTTTEATTTTTEPPATTTT